MLNTTAVIAASGWVDAEGFSDANCDRLRTYCQTEASTTTPRRRRTSSSSSAGSRRRSSAAQDVCGEPV